MTLRFSEIAHIDWPDGIPTDCTKLDTNDDDCMAQGLQFVDYCASCQEYERREVAFYELHKTL